MNRRKDKANLFVLDLFFSEGRESTEEERNMMVKLKEEVDIAQKRLNDYLFKIGQTHDGGIRMMEYIKKHYPTTPIVFYTRKGNLRDVLACMKNGADGVCPKAAAENFDINRDRIQQLKEAALKHHDAISEYFFQKTSSTSITKKAIKFIKEIYTVWKKI